MNKLIPEEEEEEKQTLITKTPLKKQLFVDPELKIFGKIVSRKFYLYFWQFLWNLSLGAFSSTIQFWVPDFYFSDINFANSLKNAIGSFVIAMTGQIAQIKFQYTQTYLMYNAIQNSFCSVFTTFGNVIEDTEKVMYFDYWWISPVFLIGNLILSFFFHYLGVVVANKFKKGVKYSTALSHLDGEDYRMNYEIDNYLTKSSSTIQDMNFEFHPKFSLFQNKESALPTDLNSDSDLKMSANDLDSESDHENQYQNDHFLDRKRIFLRNNPKMEKNEIKIGKEKEDEQNADNDYGTFQLGKKKKVSFYLKSIAGKTPLNELSEHIEKQFSKKIRHRRLQTKRRHRIIITIMLVLSMLNFLFARFPAYYPTNSIHSPGLLVYYCGITLLLNVSGAFAGNFLTGDLNRVSSVQWGTFRTNIISCLLIATAHNVLIFRYSFSDSFKFVLFINAFISNFCGSESSWAGLIDETVNLFNADISKKFAIRNLFWNLFVCFAFYLVLIYFVRFLLFFTA
eukprot:Anaeramoba_ignava/a4937_14.p1 GENE.a4937_14~~a4937_14.p1  ORF type:complete len:510 (-),score=124.67 a4937_14:18-1547(-)